MTKRSIAMCSHCGAAPATTLKINKENPDLDGYDVGCPETQKLLEENDIGNNPIFMPLRIIPPVLQFILPGKWRTP